MSILNKLYNKIFLNYHLLQNFFLLNHSFNERFYIHLIQFQNFQVQYKNIQLRDVKKSNQAILSYYLCCYYKLVKLMVHQSFFYSTLRKLLIQAQCSGQQLILSYIHNSYLMLFKYELMNLQKVVFFSKGLKKSVIFLLIEWFNNKINKKMKSKQQQTPNTHSEVFQELHREDEFSESIGKMPKLVFRL
ncbi:unnamed protein product (macronuclear) [Paramecium tetraurelia]|uniref:Transmembrane protein n=1 Tax=Paramecium tetraurelia TaxID=5888 RepID=A0BQX4_PARTE|nr:uncharacterized protein GSPATT00031170001 [Paramecium tetraurelia]CAK60941.1 unnamed protein product [Paramecium tetraurelia]|eukprot:XP_001428339.1 hypothetical protein (macronuclear) [Paramecium tetraurelia strain d4-2]